MSKSEEPTTSKPILQINNTTSLLDLKTEFIKRKKAATDQINLHHRDIEFNRSKSTLLVVTKEEKKKKEEEREIRSNRIRQNAEAIYKEEQEYNKRQKILVEKSKLYERMVENGEMHYQDGKEAEFLVNFQEKKREIEEKKDYKASSSCNEDSYKEDNRAELPAPLIVHYDPSEGKLA